MKRHLFIATFVMLAAVPLLAQAPKGWKLRTDRSTNASDPDAAGAIKLMAMGSGLHAVNPQAATYWNPANTATGNYTLKGTFKLVKTGGYDEYYGLIFAGSDLEGPQQNYLYFMVTDSGSWLVKRRTGDGSTQNVAGAASSAVKKPDSSGTSTNALEVRVMPDKIDFLVNGTVVNSSPKAGQTAKTDGIYGFRVNHHLEVEVDGLGVSK